MSDFIVTNLATILIAAGLAVVVTLVVIWMVRRRKNEKNCCSSGCGSCQFSQGCSQQQNKESEDK